MKNFLNFDHLLFLCFTLHLVLFGKENMSNSLIWTKVNILFLVQTKLFLFTQSDFTIKLDLKFLLLPPSIEDFPNLNVTKIILFPTLLIRNTEQPSSAMEYKAWHL